jgi:hypothetical protein
MQDVVSSRDRTRGREQETLQNLEQTLEQSSEEERPRADKSHRWPGVISIIAIAFSAISLYQTVLKPAELTLNVGEIVRYTRDPVTNAEVLAIPITIANRGARDATVAGLDLRLEAGARRRMFRASFVGSGSTKEPEPFAPWPVAGRGAHAAIVRFVNDGEAQDGDRQALIGAPASYRVCLSVRAETGLGLLDRILQSPPPALSFSAALAWFSASDLAIGKSIPMRTQDIAAVEGGEGACR